MNINATIKNIQKDMREDPGIAGDGQRIGQLGWMLFLKIFDDREKEIELIDNEHTSIIAEKLRWRNWAGDAEGMTGDTLLNFINNELFPGLQNLEIGSPPDPSCFIIRSVFEDAYNYMKNGTSIRKILNKIEEGIDFNKKENVHIFNEVYEKILKDLQSAGNYGEFYTPRGVTQFMTDMVSPKLGEKILDPACGTGGFLVCAIEYIRKQEVKNIKDEKKLQKNIFGIEWKQIPHVLCVTNMLLHGIDVPSQIRHDDTLSKPLRSYRAKDRVDVILTNPPFGGSMVEGTEANFPAAYRTKETADLFMILIMHLLKDGGQAAIVLPDTILFKEDGVKLRIKEKLLTECNLHTIVRLPDSVFKPYANVATNLLFFEKGKATKEVWYFDHPLPEGYKAYSKTKPIRIEEFDIEKAWWNCRVENQYAWKVDVEEIFDNNLSLDFKNPNKKEVGPGDPRKLQKEYKQQVSEFQKTKNKLKKELQKILGGK